MIKLLAKSTVVSGFSTTKQHFYVLMMSFCIYQIHASIEDIRDAVLNLQHIAKNLRAQRVANGSVRIEQIKVGFTWDEETKIPNGYFPYIRREESTIKFRDYGTRSAFLTRFFLT